MTDTADERATGSRDDETLETGRRPASAATANVSADVAPELFES
jgi:hypothetical protein